MTRIAAVALLLAAGVGAGWLLFHRHPGAAQEERLVRATVRARADYANQSYEDYERARLELAPFSDALDKSAAYHLDEALLDLGEADHLVHDQDRLAYPQTDYARLLDSARRHLERARSLTPHDEAVAYNLARTDLKLAPSVQDPDHLVGEAAHLLEPLTKGPRPDAATLLLYGGAQEALGADRAALTAMQALLAEGENHVREALYRSARFQQARLKMRIPGLEKEGEAEQEQWLKDYPDRPKPPAGALEMGRYTLFRPLAPVPKTRPDPRPMHWLDVTARTQIPPLGSPGCLLVADLDGDCAPDLVLEGKTGLRVLRNYRNGVFEDRTASSGLPADFPIRAAAVGDVDNDGRLDLVVGGPKGLRLYLSKPGMEEASLTRWRYVQATGEKGASLFGPTGKEPVTCVVLWDYDHDGVLDVFAGGSTNRLYKTTIERPTAGGVYLRCHEVARELGLASPPASEALMIDLDDDGDPDLVTTGPQGNSFFENLRARHFERHAFPAGTGLSCGDADNDLREEVRVGGRLYKWTPAGMKDLGPHPPLLDCDGDGVLDRDPLAGLDAGGKVEQAVAADLNRDGANDLLVRTDRGLRVYLGRPDRPAAWLDVRPRGRNGNEFGIGAKVYLFCGDLRVGATCRNGSVHFGLGRRAPIDALEFRWTSGVEQGVTGPGINQCLTIREREEDAGSWRVTLKRR